MALADQLEGAVTQQLPLTRCPPHAPAFLFVTPLSSTDSFLKEETKAGDGRSFPKAPRVWEQLAGPGLDVGLPMARRLPQLP